MKANQKQIRGVWLAVGVLIIGWNIFLLFRYQQEKQLVNGMTSLLISRDSSLSHSLSLTYLNQSLSLPGPKHLKVVARFTDVGCPICMSIMIDHLNKLNQKFPGIVEAYYQGRDSTLMQNMGAKFTWHYLSIKERFLSVPIQTYNPVCAVVDHSGVVQWLHIMKPQMPNHLRIDDLFFRRISSLLSSVPIVRTNSPETSQE